MWKSVWSRFVKIYSIWKNFVRNCFSLTKNDVLESFWAMLRNLILTFKFWHSDYRPFGLSTFQTNDLSDYRPFGLSTFRTIDPSDQRPFGLTTWTRFFYRLVQNAYYLLPTTYYLLLIIIYGTVLLHCYSLKLWIIDK